MKEPLVTNRRQAGVLVDENMNPSMPFWVGGLDDVDSVSRKVESCGGPLVTEEKRLLRKPKTEFHCPVLGRLAISPKDDAYRIIASQVNL
jgi:hypothetical protein